MSLASLVFTATVLITAYCPYCEDERNGTFCWSLPLAQCPYQTGTAACGWDYPFGTLMEMPEWVVAEGMPRTVVCNSRGGALSDTQWDISIIRSGVLHDAEAEHVAIFWGVRWVEVQIDLAGNALPPPAPPPAPPPSPAPAPRLRWARGIGIPHIGAVRALSPSYRAMGRKIERMERMELAQIPP